MFKFVAVLIFFLAGFSGGWCLAKKGVTADTALQRHQKQVHSISILEGVVLQTTAYSCAPATIATLNRIVHPRSQYGMKKLGLVPEYRRLLRVEDLFNRKQMALLHVSESTSGGKVTHAIALLEIDSVKDTLTVGNPLSGKRSLTPDQMKDYWRGEAIFVTAKPPNG